MKTYFNLKTYKKYVLYNYVTNMFRTKSANMHLLYDAAEPKLLYVVDGSNFYNRLFLMEPQIYCNPKTQKVYKLMSIAIECTDSVSKYDVGVVYFQIENPKIVFVRELREFELKFKVAEQENYDISEQDKDNKICREVPYFLAEYPKQTRLRRAYYTRIT